jgi:rhamnosyltransferase
MKKDTYRKVAILLAAYNGEDWIETQLETIFSHVCVLVDVYVSVDYSTDSTLTIVEQLTQRYSNLAILPYGEKYGSAAKNFYRLIRDVDFTHYDYIAFSDQDDLWFTDKLIHGIRSMERGNYDGYSSDVIAFWPNGKKKLIKKSQAQKEYDFFFGSAGPGCTYILRTAGALHFKKFLIQNWSLANVVDLHDWLIYAYYRYNSYHWVIDSSAKIMYRQHDNNSFGANSSWRAYFSRIHMLRSGWYMAEVRKIYEILGCKKPGHIFLIRNFMQLRRKTREAFILLLILCFGF